MILKFTSTFRSQAYNNRNMPLVLTKKLLLEKTIPNIILKLIVSLVVNIPE